ncbi:hypothetical protein [Robertmurraya siralis]|uniref:hypothetical protein n=1 Tax=Robertmurraya siralis TaxID=77777 RepID=UPI0010FA0836|nr:hypothetical protein [Robertmurraya siralis]
MKYTARIIKNGEILQLNIKAENESQARSILEADYNPDDILEIVKFNRKSTSEACKQTAYDKAWRRKGTPYIKNVNGKSIMIFS